jgi:hypothetical protein
VSHPGDAPEREAEAFADDFVRDQHDTPTAGPAVPGARAALAHEAENIARSSGPAATSSLLRTAVASSSAPRAGATIYRDRGGEPVKKPVPAVTPGVAGDHTRA